MLSKVGGYFPLHPITAWKEPRKQPFADSSAALWTDDEAMQLLDVMNVVIYDDLGLGRCSEDPAMPAIVEMVDEAEVRNCNLIPQRGPVDAPR